MELLGAYVMEEAARTAAKPDWQGWVRCVVPVESGDYGVRELMRLGEDMDVIGPPPLRARMAALLAAMSRRHRAHTTIT